MSIIQEALKKVQIDNKKKEKSAIKAGEDIKKEMPSPEARPPMKKKASVSRRIADRRITAFIIPFVILAVMAAGLIFIGRAVFAKARIKYNASVPEQDVSYRPLTNFTPKKGLGNILKNGRGDFILNGVMYLEKGPKAIINNSIVGEGDMVRGAKVLKINKRNVVLLYENTEITLGIK